MCTVLKSKDIKTRKPHRCCWCAQTIDAGARAFMDVCVDSEDGDGIRNLYYHVECQEAQTCLLDDDPSALEDGWFAGDYARGSTEPQ